MKVDVCVQSHNFQRRLCWMLSSVLQQAGPVPAITFDVAHVECSGKPTMEKVLYYFQPLFWEKGFKLTSTPYKDVSRFQYRGLTRNDQLEKSDADWIVFADTDMVYPPKFFAKMRELLEGGYADSGACLFSKRRSTYLEETEALVDDPRAWNYPQVIADAWGRAAKLASRPKANVGAGYFHLANVDKLRENHGGVYQPPDRRLDWSWERKYQKAKSDMHFRKRLGGAKIPLPAQIHLQHRRDSEFGKHVDIQR